MNIKKSDNIGNIDKILRELNYEEKDCKLIAKAFLICKATEKEYEGIFIIPKVKFPNTDLFLAKEDDGKYSVIKVQGVDINVPNMEVKNANIKDIYSKYYFCNYITKFPGNKRKYVMPYTASLLIEDILYKC